MLGSTNVVQTIPSLALFGLLLPLPWLGARADRLAILALALYALLPVVRNTYVGIAGISAPVREAAIAMGLTSGQLLWHVELPLQRRFAQVTARRTKVDFVAFVCRLLRSGYSHVRRVHLVLDNLNTHMRESFEECRA